LLCAANEASDSDDLGSDILVKTERGHSLANGRHKRSRAIGRRTIAQIVEKELPAIVPFELNV
jgi:hypothetical protein